MALTHVDSPGLVQPPTSGIFRVARADQPLMATVIDPSDAALPNAGNRFDIAGGGVLYFASHPLGCYAETLARFRPTPKMRALLKDENGFMFCGGVPQDWRFRRLQVKVALIDSLPFVDLEDVQTREFLSNELALEWAALGIDDLDVSVIRGSNRLVSRAIAQWAYAASDDGEVPLYSGIRYVSRLGNHECWAVFDGTQVNEISRSTITQSNPDLVEMARRFGLRVF